MAAPFFEFGEQFTQDFRLRDNEYVVHDLADLHPGDAGGAGLAEIAEAQAHPAHEVLVVKHPHDVFRTALRIVDRNARVLSFDDAYQGIVEHQVGRQRKDIGAGDHHFADGDAVEFDGAVDHFFLEFGNLAELAAGSHDELEFVGGMNWAAAPSGVRAENPQDQATGAPHKKKDGTGNRKK